jgi:Putative DNA-binding domain
MPITVLNARDIKESVLQDLVANQVPEDKTIDYKQELPGNSDGDKRDFLADLSSFANAIGGHLVFGMTEADGVPTELIGLIGDIDKAILRLESMARDGIRPNIPGLEFVRVQLSNGRNAIIVSVPRSWNKPHQVIFQKDFRFYTRGSAGKQHIDVDELRRIVQLSHEIGERVRQFRAARVAMIMSGDTPIDLVAGARQVLHFVPLNAFDAGSQVDLRPLQNQNGLLARVMNRGGSQRYNVDGLLAFSPGAQGNEAYAQLFRNGVLEIVTHLTEWNPHGKLVLPSLAFEEEMFEILRATLAVLSYLSITPPIAVLLSFAGIKGWQMGVKDSYGIRGDRGGFDRDPLLVHELILTTVATDNVPQLLRPLIEAVWNAAGYPKSDYYDQNGNWVGENKR